MKRIVLLLTALAGTVATALAQPGCINYQGRLLDSAGQPLTNGSYTLEFRIFDSPNGTTLVWGPFLCDDGAGDGHAARAVIANGRFNVILGPHDTASRPLTNAFLDQERFVEISVNGGDPILPRQQVLSAPYALRASTAANADQLNHAPPSDFFLPPGMMVPFAGPTNNIPTGWLLCDGRAVPIASYSRLYNAISNAWGGAGTNFNLPDLRGMFLRGVNLGRTGDLGDPHATTRGPSAPGGLAGDNVGSVQTSQFRPHRHRWAEIDGNASRFSRSLYSWDVNGYGYQALRPFVAGDDGTSGDDDSFEVSAPANAALYTKSGTTVEDAGETRPNNAYVNYIIKY